MFVFKKYFLVLLLFFVSTLTANDTPWNGKWHVFWPEGAFVLYLEQHGNEVNGTYEPSHGILKGKVEHNTLNAKGIAENNKTSILSFTMGDSQNAFFGNARNGLWVGGIRVEKDKTFNTLSVKRGTPGDVLYSFLALGNSVRSGNYEGLQKAIELLEFTQEQQKFYHSETMEVISTFFEILDECIVNKRIFAKTGEKEKESVWLEQIGSDVKIPLYFVQDKKTTLWKMKVPELETLKTQLKSLLVAREKYEVDQKDNLELKHARATMRTLYEQFDRWESGGKKYVISTMNLSEIDPAIHDWQAPLLAYYLKSVLDRISYVIYQEIPNDPKSKKAYVHFHHPAGSIVIEPYMVEDKTIWQFTPQTLASIDELYHEMDHVKSDTPTKVLEENNLYFALKRVAQNISPLLIKKIYYTEVWQVLMLILIVILALLVSLLMRFVVFYLFHRYSLTKRWTEEMITLRYLRPIQIVVFSMIFLYGAHQLGLSNSLFSFIKALSHLLIVVGATWIIYNLISIVFTLLEIRARKTSTNVDEIIFSLMGSILRVLVITVAIFIVAEIFNIPYQTVLAGLGIGGLAFAIAAKDTIANFFGSAIIVADRPFKTGDKIKIGSNIGVIMNVGIRSTKIRTITDTILTVPNHNITSEMIDNYTAREAMRIDTEFFFSLNTSKILLDTIDMEITAFLKEHKGVDVNKIILIGVNDYTKRGIAFGVSFFVKASTDMEYSGLRHNLVTEIADIIKKHDIELIMVQQDYSDTNES